MRLKIWAWGLLTAALLALTHSWPVLGQSRLPTVQAELLPAPTTVPLTGPLTLAFRLSGADLQQSSPFPELEGFKKNGKTSTTTTRTVQGRHFTELTVTQRYLPYGEGEYLIKPFQLTVNGQTLRSPGGPVRVTGTTAAARLPVKAPSAVGSLDKLFGKRKPVLYEDVPDHASLELTAEKGQVFVGEGVRVGLYFYLLPTDQELLAFNDYNDQLPQLLRKLHQTTAWEVPSAAVGGVPDTVRRNGQRYLRFRLSESLYYPLNGKPLVFPPLALTMTKFKVLKTPEPGVDNRLPTAKTFVAGGLRIEVRQLPPHSLGEAAPVGDYQVRESLSRPAVRVGEALTYSFGVVGAGNLTALVAPELTPNPALDVYGPEVRETPGSSRKLFRYRVVARRPGVLRLDSLLRLVVFNPRTARYDTLRPTLRPVVRGAAQAGAAVLPKPAEDAFYGPALAQADDNLQSTGVYQQVQRYTNWLLLGLLLVAGGGWWWAGRKVSGDNP